MHLLDYRKDYQQFHHGEGALIFLPLFYGKPQILSNYQKSDKTPFQDFVSDFLYGGRRFRIFNVIDDFKKGYHNLPLFT